MEPLENTMSILRNIINTHNNPATTDNITITVDPESYESYKNDFKILLKLKELLMGGTADPQDNVDKLMKDEFSIICPKDKKTIYDAIGLTRDILVAVDKWL